MPIFKTQQQAWETHERYHYDTDLEGKFFHGHPGYNRIQQIIDWIPDVEPAVLGVGCNSGGLERTILRKRKGSSVYGVDINPELVRRAKIKGIMAREGKAEELPFNDNSFDVVVLAEILEHVYNALKVLKETNRVLKSDGVVIGSVPHNRSDNAKKGVKEHLYHTRIFTHTVLEKLLLIQFHNVNIVEIYHNPDLSGRPQWFCFRASNSMFPPR
jgi:SAM-dependent methyltransferase